MINQVDDGLRDWAVRVLDDSGIENAVVSFEPPPSEVLEGKGVSLYLFELVDTPPPRNNGRTPLQFSVKYLVSTWAEEPAEAHRILNEFAFAAMENPDFHVEFAPLDAGLWSAFNALPRPCFTLRVPVKKVRLVPEVSVVTKPISIDAVPTTRLEGVVLTPDDIPLMDVRLELKYLRISTKTDMYGRFVFPGVPREPRIKELVLTAKGYELEVAVEQPSRVGELVEIRFNPLD